jgi:hypothetical protein
MRRCDPSVIYEFKSWITGKSVSARAQNRHHHIELPCEYQAASLRTVCAKLFPIGNPFPATEPGHIRQNLAVFAKHLKRSGRPVIHFGN